MNTEKAVKLFLAAIEARFDEICAKDGRGRTGGRLCVAFKGTVLGTFEIGKLRPTDDLAGWSRECVEKVVRLLANPHTNSAYQTMEYGNKKYGGGVQLGDWAFGFAGLFFEVHNENVCLIGLASVYGPLPDEFLDLIVQCSNNSYRGEFW